MTTFVATAHPTTHAGLTRIETGLANARGWLAKGLEVIQAAQQRRADARVQAHLMRLAEIDPRILAEYRAMQARQD
jgi:hypothetical protein